MIRWFSFSFGLLLILVGLLLTTQRTNEPFYLLAFLSNRDGNSEIFRMLPDGRNLTQLTHTNPPATDSHGFCELVWLPNRFHIITSYGPNYEPGDFFCYHTYGRDFRLDMISGKVTAFDYQEKPLVWLPDGKLFIEPVRIAGRVVYELYRVRNNDKQIIANLTNWRGTPVQWSGEWIVYMDDPNADYRNEIYRLHTDGTSNQRLIPPSERTIFCDQLAIAGNWLLFSIQDQAGSCNRLYRTRMDDPHFIVEYDQSIALARPMDYAARLVPSPDGKWAAFWDVSGTIFVISAETGELQQAAPTYTYYSSMLTVNWSPDSQWLVFPSCDEFCKIFRVRPDGTDLQQLTDGPGDDVFPAYSPGVSFPWRGGLAVGAGMLCLIVGISRKNFQYYKSIR